MEKLPQRLVNIRAADRDALTAAMEAPALGDAIEREQSALSGRGRVLVRASGTEPLIRVMVEAPEPAARPTTSASGSATLVEAILDGRVAGAPVAGR